MKGPKKREKDVYLSTNYSSNLPKINTSLLNYPPPPVNNLTLNPTNKTPHPHLLPPFLPHPPPLNQTRANPTL